METRQLEHEGFEHANEWRRPCRDEWFQSSGGPDCKPFPSNDNVVITDKEHCFGKRWILKKVTPMGNPKREEAIKEMQQQIDYLNGTLIESLGYCISGVVKNLQQAVEKLKEV